jgi:Putative auto-transporter adhesin, head GIN domain
MWSYDAWKSGRGGERGVVERALPAFNRIAIEGFAELTLVPGQTESVSIDAAPKQRAGVRLEVTDGKLSIANPRPRHWWLDLFGDDVKPVRMTLTYRTLNAISVAGAAKVRADRLTDRLTVSASGATSVQISALEAQELVVNGSGAIRMDAAGRVVAQRIGISGAGDYRAAKLDSETAKVRVSGAGRVVVRAEKTLDIEISGAGSVDYFGNPKVTQEISGVGRIRRRAAD